MTGIPFERYDEELRSLKDAFKRGKKSPQRSDSSTREKKSVGKKVRPKGKHTKRTGKLASRGRAKKRY